MSQSVAVKKKSFKMKLVLAISVLISVLATVLAAKFTTKYDNLPLDEILTSDRLLGNYFDCLMGKKKCTPDGDELRRAIPSALTDDCNGCSEKQKAGAQKVVKYISDNKPVLWKALEEKYDPEGSYRKKHGKLAENLGVKV